MSSKAIDLHGTHKVGGRSYNIHIYDGETTTFHQRSRRWSRTNIRALASRRRRLHGRSSISRVYAYEICTSSPSNLRRNSRPSLPSASAFQSAPTIKHANPRYVHVKNTHPTTLKHRISPCSHPGRYIALFVVHNS